MREPILAALIAGFSGAGVTGLIQFLVTRHDVKQKASGTEAKALRYIMLYIIQERAKELLQAGSATLEEKRGLHKWHELYHDGLCGNGDADRLLRSVDELPIRLD